MNLLPNRSYLWLFWLLGLVGLAADLGSKYGVFAALYNEGKGGKYVLIPGVFDLTADYTEQPVPDDEWKPLRSISGDHMPRVNHGALFGFWNRDEHGNDGNFFFSVVSLLAAVAIVFWINFTVARFDLYLCVSLGLILAGTLGNFFDRLVFHGVRDFLHWYYLIDWPIFNLADCCLVCGAGLLLFQALFLQPPAREESAVSSSQESTEQEVVDVK